MRRPALASALVAIFAAASCGGDDEAPPPITFEMTVSVAPGQELHACQFVRMPETGGEIFVSGGTYEATSGTHHFLLSRTAPDMPEKPMGQPIDCNEGDGVMQYERGFVSGGQLERDTAELPFGLALPFAPGEVLMMQSHIVNASAEEANASVKVELTRARPEWVEHRVGTFRFYNPFIHVPANGTSTAAMRCHIHADVQMLTAGGHMHARGVGYRAFVDMPGSAPAVEPFYTTNEWQHPDYHVGVVDLPAGSAVRFACDYANASDRAAFQGRSVDDEMCMLSAFYYPAQDFDEEVCTSMDSHGTGTRSCAQTNSCIQLCDPSEVPKFTESSAEVGPCFQACIVESCPNVTAALFPQLSCTKEHCAEACAEFGMACSACVQDNCKPQLDTCQALACGS